MKTTENHSTKIAVCSINSDFVMDTAIHVVNYSGNKIDFIKANGEEENSNSDFVLLQVVNSSLNLKEVQPNIAVLCENQETEIDVQQLIQNITAGGILIYPEGNTSLDEQISTTTNYFRKIPFKTPYCKKIGNQTYIDSDLGEIPLNISETEIPYLEASRILCQQIGIQQEDFFEAMVNF